MKHQTTNLLWLAALLAVAANAAHADVILFQDNFESGSLSQWVGKSGAPHQGQIVADPLNPANHVLTFTGVNFSGDMFTAAPLNVSRPRQYILSFDFLGMPGSVENGGFIGLAAAPTSDSQQFWLGGTYPGALTAPSAVATTLVADGKWHHYKIDFTEIVEVEGLTQTLLTLEDWFNFGSIPGDAFFDNVCVVGVFDTSPILAKVPCEGPAPGKKWKNHGAYVSTVSKVVEAYLLENIITEEEAEAIMSAAGQSDCGKTKSKPSPKPVSNPAPNSSAKETKTPLSS